MQENFYKILGITQEATDEEIEIAYQSLKKELRKDMFAEGEKGNIAAQKLTQVESAYNAIKSERESANKQEEQNEPNNYDEVEALIKTGDYDGAQAKLDSYSVRDAEWHYLQSLVFYRKNWTNESKKQLEIALQMDPNNEKYQKTNEKFDAKMKENDNRFKSGNADFGNEENGQNAQMGADFCSTCSDCLTAYCCASMCTNCCCR